ncbi:MAG: tRNA (N(6)-L-threonylcarbamoyladenosine(37)-C(2))-methylthiotransferase MtaB [Nitrospiraceae bacterium]|nr:MAG: tRNA (N(6)-L-threonylcarbamoyladenosine(37)-C(2))-methylthiotransferase MtaB [Nitrospiraceae bacterium]
MIKVTVQTLGCKVNQSESASIEEVLREQDIEIVKLSENPDICIVNTCSVTAKSDYQSRQLIRKAARNGAKVIATGCYAQLRPDELSKIEGLDLIIGNSEKSNIPQYIKKLTMDKWALELTSNHSHSKLSSPSYYSSRSRGVLKIQDGCNASCSYCTVPLARGKSRSVEIGAIFNAAEKLQNNGYREIVLTGIHIGIFGLDIQPQSSLLGLVEMLTRSFPDIRFRLSSIEPLEFNMGFLPLIRNGLVCNHLHIPLQSGTDRILSSMNREYTSATYKNLIESIINEFPDIAIGTDIITGFPGETDRDFQETVSYVEQIPFSYLHIFPYSRRPNTKAFCFEGHIPEHVKKERVQVLLEMNTNMKSVFKNKQLNKILDVIVEGKDETSGYYKGISGNYLKIFIKSNDIVRGQRIKVRVISLTDSGLLAEYLK